MTPIPLEETDWFKSGRHQAWVERNENLGHAARWIRVYEGTDPRLLELQVIAKSAKGRFLYPKELEEIYEEARKYPRIPFEIEAPKKAKGLGTPNYKVLVDHAKKMGFVPLSAHLISIFKLRLDKLTVGGYVEVIYANEANHRTVKGDYVGYDEKQMLVMGHTKTGDRFYKSPIEMILWVTYNKADHGTIRIDPA